MEFNKYEELDQINKPILILDSGLGGISALTKLKELYPVENFILLCDNEMMPLGNKNIKILNRRVQKIIQTIKAINPKDILIACNTLDSVGLDIISSSLPGINVYGIIKPTMEKAINTTKSNKIAILATKNTIQSQSYMKYSFYKKNLQVYGVECLNLAKAIEDGLKIKETFNEEIFPLNEVKFDTLVLGCTHYSKIKNTLVDKKFKNKNIVDSTECLIQNYGENKNQHLANKANKQWVDIILTNKEDEVILNNLKKNLVDQYKVYEQKF